MGVSVTSAATASAAKVSSVTTGSVSSAKVLTGSMPNTMTKARNRERLLFQIFFIFLTFLSDELRGLPYRTVGPIWMHFVTKCNPFLRDIPLKKDRLLKIISHLTS